MKCTIPEISWHNRDPVLSIDIQPTNNGLTVPPYRLATGGSDSHVVIWYVTVKECGLASVEVAADLQRHQRAVNCVRFSPSGQFLASGDDESVIIVWKPKTEHDISDLTNPDNEEKEQWVSFKTLRGHLEDVYDISWSLDSTHLVSGSIDNTAIIWDVHKGRNLGILSGHGGFIQGVTWDPKNKYVATLSSDRTCRIHKISSKKLTAKISKAVLPVPSGSELCGKVMRLFHDDTLKSFFRRLSFSPDGEILVTPSGVIEIPNTEKHINATYIFSRYDFSKPVVYLPSPVEYTVAVRFCPLLFKLREGSPLFSLPYRMVFAIATKSNVILYDTQQSEPIALISNIHYTRLTDLSWSGDGRVLIASSTDGYCSIITFSEEELGEVYELPKVDVQSSENEIQNSENKLSDSMENSVNEQHYSSEQDTNAKTDNGEKEKAIEANVNKTPVRDVPAKAENDVKKNIITLPPVSAIEKKSPRRITLITLSSPRKRRITTQDTKNSGKSTEKSMVPEDDSDHEVADTTKGLIRSTSSSREEMDCEKIAHSKSEKPPVTVVVKDSVDPALSEEVISSTCINKEEDAKPSKILESCEEPMEVDETPCLASLHSDVKDDSCENEIPRTSVETSCENENSKSRTSVAADKISQDSGELNEKNFNPDDIKKNEDCTEDEELSTKYLSTEKEKTNTQQSNSSNNLLDKCSESPVKIGVANVGENTPSKKTDLASDNVHTATHDHVSDEVHQPDVTSNIKNIEKKTPRRVQFITISSPKSKKKLM